MFIHLHLPYSVKILVFSLLQQGKIILENGFSQEFQSIVLIFSRVVQNKVTTTLLFFFFLKKEKCAELFKVTATTFNFLYASNANFLWSDLESQQKKESGIIY